MLCQGSRRACTPALQVQTVLCVPGELDLSLSACQHSLAPASSQAAAPFAMAQGPHSSDVSLPLPCSMQALPSGALKRTGATAWSFWQSQPAACWSMCTTATAAGSAWQSWRPLAARYTCPERDASLACPARTWCQVRVYQQLPLHSLLWAWSRAAVGLMECHESCPCSLSDSTLCMLHLHLPERTTDAGLAPGTPAAC